MTNFNPNPFPGFTPTTFHFHKPIKSIFAPGQKAGTNGSLVVMVVDESGSMSSHKSQTISGYNEFLQGQEKDSDQTYISLVNLKAAISSSLIQKYTSKKLPA